VASAHSFVLVFTESGRVHWLKVHQIPQAGPAAKGKAIVNLLQLEEGERAATTVAVRDFSDDRYLVFASERGVVKKTRLSAFGRPRLGGIIAAVVDPEDHLLSVKVTDGEHDVFLATADGYSIRFSEKELRAMGRVSRGVKGISLRADDKVVSMEVLDRDGDLVSVTELGFGKGTHVGEYRIQGRGGKGIINLKLSPKTGRIVGVRLVDPGDELMLVSQEGKIIRIGADGIRRTGRAAMGVRVMDLEGEDRLVAFARITDETVEDHDQEAQEGTDEPEPVN
jgi:DNA gyrase subunit A